MKLGKIDATLLFGPISLFMLGYALNKICMGVNGGAMPVQWPVNWGVFPEDANHILMTAYTHLNFLGDWINVHQGVASIGDTLMEVYRATWFPGIVAFIARLSQKSLGGSDYRSELGLDNRRR